MIALALILAALQDLHSWNTITDGEIVQYGVPQSDDRALRIACRRGGGLEILGPSGVNTSENMPTQVTFRRGTERITVLGVTVYMGDGLNFAVPVAASELPITTLLAGDPITIEHGDAIWEVPGTGAPAVLRPLVEDCAR